MRSLIAEGVSKKDMSQTFGKDHLEKKIIRVLQEDSSKMESIFQKKLLSSSKIGKICSRRREHDVPFWQEKHGRTIL